MVDQTLSLLETWYREPTSGNERPKLLSKMAIIEFCGWLELWMDEFVLELSQHCLNDDKWVSDLVLQKTYGFEYNLHLRPMIGRIIGEHLVRIAESRFEHGYPGELAQIKSQLGSLWRTRCQLAHANIIHNVAQQVTFDAPSWTINQHRILNRRLSNFRSVCVGLAAAVPMS